MRVLYLVLNGLTATSAVVSSTLVLYASETVYERGQALVEQHCTRCHATKQATPSPFFSAPPLAKIANLYPAEHLAEAFAEGISVGHDAMPEFVFEPHEIAGLIAYLNSFSDLPSQ